MANLRNWQRTFINFTVVIKSQILHVISPSKSQSYLRDICARIRIDSAAFDHPRGLNKITRQKRPQRKEETGHCGRKREKNVYAMWHGEKRLVHHNTVYVVPP
mmetsp:Transcript_6869/g.9888  ORF Transcript_6869/g.9888 Transcript_6869/m.9888 type:complete len:103 (+) Transcript_6869:778-1086(+)